MPEKVKFDFISKMAANPYKESSIMSIINDTLNRENFDSRGKEAVISWFTPKILKNLYKNNINLQSPIIIFQDRQVKHSLSARKIERQRLTETQFKKIYKYINSPDEIFIDTEQQAVIYVIKLKGKDIIDNCDCIKIPIEINSSNKRRPLNYIGTTGRVNYQQTFSNTKKYKKIE